jgi:hypothetical protein
MGQYHLVGYRVAAQQDIHDLPEHFKKLSCENKTVIAWEWSHKPQQPTESKERIRK